ncbi:MAG: Ig-like domain-containing protein [Lachnospiraceae bacterium]|nr:Ig-like domain-containing protein [Lachnospiraceae bacterium]
MQNKKVWHRMGKRCAAALLTTGLLAGALPMDLLAAEARRDVPTSDTQIASPVETVYTNMYMGSERTMNFNSHWKFNLGDSSGAEGVSYDDSAWRSVDLPHDYSIEQEYTASGEAESAYLPGGIGWYRKNFTVDSNWSDKRLSIEFDGVYMNAEVYLNGEKLGSHPYGYTAFSFELPSEQLHFGEENVIAVKVSNQVPSSRWYSGSGIYRDVKLTVTDKVHVDRHGITVKTPDIANNNTGTVKITAKVANDSSEEKTNLKVVHTITEKGSTETVATVESTIASVAAGQVGSAEATATVTMPKLWNVWDKGEANLYEVHTQVKDSADVVLDSYDTTFGFRYYSFDAAEGFSLNGERMKLRGVCMHHDQGALGSEAWYRAIERQVELLKDMGCNAIRVTHNPAAEILLEVCNEKGMLVIDEAFDGWTWTKNGNSNDYAAWFKRTIEADNTIEGGSSTMTWAEFDIKSMVSRGKNAPSMIMWSLGNEIVEGTATDGSAHANNGTKEDRSNKSYADIARDLIGWVEEIDDTRPVTFGDNKLKNGQANMKAVARVIHEADGVIGFNYASNAQMTSNRESGWRIYGSETASHVNSRGVYDYKGGASQTANQNLTSYDKSAVGWGAVASDAWYRTITMDANAGEFVWTGFDYLGEPTPWNGTGTGSTTGDFNVAPKSSYFGIIETTGFPKDNYYLYRSMWNTKSHTLHILPTWNEEDVVKDGSGNVEVVVYSDAPTVELFLNGRSLGQKTFAQMNSDNGGYTYQAMSGVNGHTSLYRTWSVPYAEGTLTARAYDAQNQEITDTVGRSEVKTTGQAQKLSVTADRREITADGRDLSYITIDVQDMEGNFVNGAEPEITLSIEGNGKIIGVDNGRQNDHTSFQSLTRNAFRGKLLAIVQSTDKAGSFTLTARSSGLASGSVTVTTEADAQEGGSTEAHPVSVEYSRVYYVKRGSALTLPTQLQVKYSNGTQEMKAVTWDSGEVNTSEVGTSSRTGKIDNTIPVKIYINVLDEVTALLNYSAAVQVGAQMNLPATRPAVMADGEILDAYFPVEWDTSQVDTDTPGTYVAEGTAQVFGRTLNPTATIRVSEGEVLQGANVAFKAAGIYYGAERSIELEMIRDNNTAVDSEAWTGTGEVKFEYDTAQNINKVVLHMKDTAPVSGTMSVTWSPDGTTWQEMDARVTNTKEDGKTIRTYSFDMVPAVWIKLDFDSAVKLLEAELYVGVAEFGIGNSASLEELVVKGRIVEESALAAGRYGIQDTALTAEDIQATGEDNASCTILPARDNRVLILTESEDHSRRGRFEITLGQSQASNMEADDDSHDYPHGKTTASAASQQSGEEASKAVDNDLNTLWHTSWNANLSSTPEQRYIQLTLEETTTINALRYLPRASDSNGIVTEYRIEVSTDGNTWTQVANGNWASNNVWKIAPFSDVEARYVRLYGVATAGNTANQFMSAREIRVCVPSEDLFHTAQATLEQQEYDFTGRGITPEPVVTLKEGGTVLEKDVDYTLSYQNNTKPGTRAAVLIRGIGSYSGTLRLYFTINDTGLSVVSFEDVMVNTEEGVAPVLPGTVTANLSGGTTEELEVTWPAITEAQYARAGEFFVTGEVEGESIKPAARIVVRGVVGVEQISTVTASGVAPALPGRITVYKSDGSEELAEVAWNLDGVSFDGEAGTFVTIEGTVEGTEQRVTARVRLAEAVQSNTNMALNTSRSGLPLAIAYVSSGGDNPFNATDGNKTFNSGTGKTIWSDWERSTYHTDNNWMGVILGSGDRVEKKTVNRVSIGFMEEDGNSANKVKLPSGYKIEYYTGPDGFTYNGTLSSESNRTGNGFVREWADSPLKDPANWTEVTYTGTKPSVPALNNFKSMVDVTFEPVSASIIRISLTPQASQWTGLEEFEVYGYDIQANDSFTLEELTLGGRDIKDEITATAPYEAELGLEDEIPEITARATNNASVTILRPAGKNGTARVIIKPENGSQEGTITYQIRFVSTDISVGDISWTAQPAEGEKLRVKAPAVKSDLRLEKQGWQICMAGQSVWEDFDIDTVLDPVYEGARLRYHAENGEAEANSNELTITMAAIVPVTGITGIPAEIKVGTAAAIKAAVTPANATNRTVSLRVTDKGTTDAAVTAAEDGGLVITAKAAGTLVIRATVADGLGIGRNFTKDYTVKAVAAQKHWIFTDVDVVKGNWKYESVKFVYDNDIMGAITGTTNFQPDRPLSRSMFATVLYRMAGEPKVTFENKFTDVPGGKWYSNAIIWAYKNKIVAGYTDGSFGIDDNITREQIAKMLFEYARVSKYDISERNDLGSFTDKASVSNWAVEYMQWATAVKMITGKPNDDQKTYRMDPKGAATRAECAAMLTRFAEKYNK